MAQTLYTLHNKNVVDSVPFGREYLILCKEVQTESMTRYFVRMVDGKLINPAEVSAHELKKYDGAYVLVAANVFDLYVRAIHGETRVPFRSIERLI